MKRRRKQKSRQSSQFEFSSLEDRRLLAGITFDAATGVATVQGTDGVDQVQVFQTGSKVQVVYHGQESAEFNRSELTEVFFRAGGGDDWFRNNTNLPSRVYGQAGNDTIIGGFGNDRLLGGADDDRIFARNGDDFVSGDDGKDFILGNNGANQLIGGGDDDRIIGGLGNDSIYGQAGNDILYGLDGDDFMSGGDDDDTLVGQKGKDSIRGERGRDRIWGGDDDDSLHGGDDDDRLVGGLGNDDMFGDNGSDHMQGNAGLDRMFGSWGDDMIFGGEDDDLLVGNQGKDSLVGEDGNDEMYGHDDDDYLNGGRGRDRMLAGSGNDILRGGDGRDRLFGQDGSDWMDGEDGNDDLDGGRDSDHMKGGHGNDDYFSDDSDDVYDDSDDFSSNDDFEIRAAITNLDTNAKTFQLMGVTVDYSVAYVEGSIANGNIVKAEGSYDGATLLAKEVEREDNSNQNFEARGTVANLDTANQTFEFFGFQVSYSNARVEGQLSDSVSVEVKGNLNSNGQIAAAKVEVYSDSNNGGGGGDDNGGDDNGGDRGNGELELRGLISNLDTNAKTFSLLGITVNYSGAQLQGNLSNGSYFKAEGTYGTVLNAREVQAETPDDRDENVELRGTVSNLDTQNQTFEILGFTVDFSSAELETSFGNGDSVEVEGWLANGMISAEEIKA